MQCAGLFVAAFMYHFGRDSTHHERAMNKLTPVLLLLALSACGKPSAPVNPVDAVARRTCMDTIEARATNRKSIAYDDADMSPVVHTEAAHPLTVSIKLSAKNELGMASPLLATCHVSADGKTLVDINVKDRR